MQSKAFTYIMIIFLPLAALAVGVIVGLSLKTPKTDVFSTVEVANTSRNGNISVNTNTNVAANTNSTNGTPNATNTATNASTEGDGEKSSLNNLDVDWLKTPAVVAPASLGLKVVDPSAPKTMTVNEAYKVFNVGTIKTAPWKGDRLLLIETRCYGPCPNLLYRVIDDRNVRGFVFLKNLSNPILDYDEQFFSQENNYDIPDLHLPASLAVASGGSSYVLEEEDFSPSVRFDQYTLRTGAKPTLLPKFTHEKVGTIYENTEEGTFFVKNSDTTVKLYRLKFPFTLSDDSNAGHLIQSASLSLLLTDGTLAEGIYTPVSWMRICPPREYRVYTGIDSKFTKAGTFGANETFYATKSASDPLNKEIYDAYISYAPQNKTLTLDQFTKDHGVIFWKDGLGRWFRMFQTKYEPGVETECSYIDSAL